MSVLVRQASIGGCEPGIREGCPYISSDHMKFDELVCFGYEKRVVID